MTYLELVEFPKSSNSFDPDAWSDAARADMVREKNGNSTGESIKVSWEEVA